MYHTTSVHNYVLHVIPPPDPILQALQQHQQEQYFYWSWPELAYPDNMINDSDIKKLRSSFKVCGKQF